MRIKSVRFHKAVELGRDSSRQGIINGQELKGPDWPDGATVHLEFLDGRIAYLLRDKSGKPVSGKLFPAGENVEQIVVEAADLAAELDRRHAKRS